MAEQQVGQVAGQGEGGSVQGPLNMGRSDEYYRVLVVILQK